MWDIYVLKYYVYFISQVCVGMVSECLSGGWFALKFSLGNGCRTLKKNMNWLLKPKKLTNMSRRNQVFRWEIILVLSKFVGHWILECLHLVLWLNMRHSAGTYSGCSTYDSLKIGFFHIGSLYGLFCFFLMWKTFAMLKKILKNPDLLFNEIV